MMILYTLRITYDNILYTIHFSKHLQKKNQHLYDKT